MITPSGEIILWTLGIFFLLCCIGACVVGAMAGARIGRTINRGIKLINMEYEDRTQERVQPSTPARRLHVDRIDWQDRKRDHPWLYYWFGKP